MWELWSRGWEAEQGVVGSLKNKLIKANFPFSLFKNTLILLLFFWIQKYYLFYLNNLDICYLESETTP